MTKVALIAEGIPNAKSSGGPLTAWGVMRGLQSHGVSVIAIALPSRSYSYAAMRDIYRTDCEATGAAVYEIDEVPRSRSRLIRRLIAPSISDIYAHSRYAPQVADGVLRIKPDVLVSYHFEGLAATLGITSVPRIALVGDPTHLPLRHHFAEQPLQWNATYAREGVAALAAQFQHPRIMADMLNSVSACGAFAAHHADWFRSVGARRCEYYRTPMEDPLGPEWRSMRDKFPKSGKPKIMLVGHLRSTVTSSGLGLFAREILPLLEKRLGADAFEVHIIGASENTLSAELQKLLDRPSIRIRGYVESVAPEFLSADVLFVPTPIKLGIRVRIITGFSYGICVVAHAANSLGIPEMVNGQNALLGENSQELAHALVRALEDGALRRTLENASRETFEKFFHAPVATQKIFSKIPLHTT